MGKHLIFSKIVLFILLSFSAYTETVKAASPSPGSLFTYEGILTDSSGNPIITSQNLTFEIIYSTSCVTYSETQSITPGASGEFSVIIGSGNRTDSTGNTASRIFASSGNINCEGGSPETVSGFTSRSLRIHIGSTVLTPDVTIGNIPFAINAQNLGDTPANAVLRVDGGITTPLTPANFTELLALLNGSSTKYEKSGKLSGATLPTMSNGQVLGWSGGTWSAVTPLTSYTETDPSVKTFAKSNLPTCVANQFLQNDGSGNLVCTTPSSGGSGTVTNIAAGAGLRTDKAANAPITDNGTLSVDVGTGANQIVQLGSDTKLPAVDGSKLTNVVASELSSTASINTSGNITTSGALSANSITNTNIYTDNLYIRSPAAGGNQIHITGPTTPIAANYILRLPQALPAAGTTKVLASDDGGNLSWVTQGAGNYITTLTGDVTSSSFSSGSVTTSVDKIKGVAVFTAVTGDDQKFLKYVYGSGWQPQFIKLSELKNSLGTDSAFNATGCTAAQTLMWTSLTDQFICQDITLPAEKVTGLAAVATSGSYNDLTSKPALGALATKSSVSLNTTDVTNVLPIDNGGTGTNSVAPKLFFAGPTNGSSTPPIFRGIASTDLPVVARADHQNLTTAKPSSPLFTANADDFYNICIFFQVQVAGGSGDLAPEISFISGDDYNPTSGTLTGSIPIANPGWRASCTPIFAKAGTVVYYSTVLYSGSLNGLLKYSLHIRVTNIP